MRPLETLREDWIAIEREERRLPVTLSIDDSVRIFLSLYSSMTHLMEETKELFQLERQQHLAEQQTRLRRLDTWRRKHGTAAEST